MQDCTHRVRRKDIGLLDTRFSQIAGAAYEYRPADRHFACFAFPAGYGQRKAKR